MIRLVDRSFDRGFVFRNMLMQAFLSLQIWQKFIM
jgi:hypothetical protein